MDLELTGKKYSSLERPKESGAGLQRHLPQREP